MAKKGAGSTQWDILIRSGIPEAEVPKFRWASNGGKFNLNLGEGGAAVAKLPNRAYYAKNRWWGAPACFRV